MADSEEHLRSEQDLEEILRIAISQSSGATSSDDLRARLRETAQEIGISEEQLRAAEEKYKQELDQRRAVSAIEQDEAIEAAELRVYRKERAAEFQQHAFSYLIVNSMIAGINFFVNGLRSPFFVYVLLGWGIGLAFHALAVYGPMGEEGRKEFKKWQKKYRKRLNSQAGKP